MHKTTTATPPPGGLITVYRDGRVRLTKQAAAHFNIGDVAELRPGSSTAPWVLDVRADAPQPVSVSHATWQFRSGYRLERVFPHNSRKEKIVLAAVELAPSTPGLFALRPVA